MIPNFASETEGETDYNDFAVQAAQTLKGLFAPVLYGIA